LASHFAAIADCHVINAMAVNALRGDEWSIGWFITASPGPRRGKTVAMPTGNLNTKNRKAAINAHPGAA
jgi:hypothetical protein